MSFEDVEAGELAAFAHSRKIRVGFVLGDGFDGPSKAVGGIPRSPSIIRWDLK